MYLWLHIIVSKQIMMENVNYRGMDNNWVQYLSNIMIEIYK